MAIPITADQIGPKYDILISTRDGTSLSCKGRPPQRTAQNVSQVAYMCSTNPQTPMEESTELQRKDALTSQASNQEIDRQFSAWPQASQGDWSDGMGQRVFSGGQNRPTRYWDGLGVLWPVNDYLPQIGYLASPDNTAEGGAIMVSLGAGVAGGEFNNIGTAVPPSFAYSYMQHLAPQHNIVAIQTSTGLEKIDPVPGSTNGTPFIPANNGSLDYVFAGGVFWLVTAAGSPATITLAWYATATPPLLIASTTWTGFIGQAIRIAAGRVGNQGYVAVLYAANAAGQAPTIRLFDVNNFSAVFGSAVDIQVADAGVVTRVVWQMDFLGDSLVVAASTGDKGVLSAYTIATQTWSTLAVIPNASNLTFCPIAGGLFVLAAYDTAATGGLGDIVDMYLLQGGGLQHVGQVQIQSSGVSFANAVAGILEPQSFGPYAVFGVYYRPQSLAHTAIQIFCYDVLRGRLFKMQDFGGYNIFLRPDNAGRRMAVLGPLARPTPAGTLASQWVVSIPTLSQTAGADDTVNCQNVMMGVSTNNFGTPFLQQGVRIGSSLIDFTSAENKLYRQAVASFTPLPTDSAITVELDVWLDQDPANLTPVPTFSTGVVGAGVNGGVAGQTQLKLPINTVARKLAYQAVTTGPSTTPTAAVKLISVAIQAATGWVIHYYLDLSKAARTNGGSAYCYQDQGLDELHAYNFLRQLWRLRGGECTITLANGDSYNALLQLIDGKSPKPFGAPEQPGFQQIVEIKIREDV